MSMKQKRTVQMEKKQKKDDESSFESFDSEGRPSPKQVMKKKNLQVIIQASCLSIELRKADDKLIAEFCMVNFDYGLQIFEDDVQRIYMEAYSLFIFHDEDPHNKVKQVMFGHINASNSMTTTEEFYKTLPQKMREEKLKTMKAAKRQRTKQSIKLHNG